VKGVTDARHGEDQRDERAEETGGDDAQHLLFPGHETAHVVEAERAEERDPAVREHHDEQHVLHRDAHREELAEAHHLVLRQTHEHERADERRDGDGGIDGGMRSVTRRGRARVRCAPGLIAQRAGTPVGKGRPAIGPLIRGVLKFLLSSQVPEP
jgi:hypothetical protein